MAEKIPSSLVDICNRFTVAGLVDSIQPYGSGHIHDTYIVECEQLSEKRLYILQKFNTSVFPDAEAVMRNATRVTQHLRQRLQGNSFPDYAMEVVNYIPVSNGGFLYSREDGSYWRMMSYFDGRCATVGEQDAHDAGLAGIAFGRFLALLDDLDPASLEVTIPDFHDVRKRLDRFAQAVERDKVGKLSSVQPEIAFVNRRKGEMERFRDWLESGEVPVRVVHNDPKFNNVLFNEKNRSFCVIDLDTLMPGHFFHDFGDAVRTSANQCSEDEPNFSAAGLSLPLFEAFSRGFIPEIQHFLTHEEKMRLSFAPKYMTFIIGLRFLTDYLMGDVYYKTTHPQHNLQRARVQLRLLQDMKYKSDKVEQIVHSCLNA